MLPWCILVSEIAMVKILRTKEDDQGFCIKPDRITCMSIRTSRYKRLQSLVK